MADDWDLDAELLERCREGNAQACQQLFERHVHVVIRFFRNKADVEDLEDLAQETMTRLFSAVGRIHTGRTTRAFVMQIARHVLLEYFRKQGGKRSFDPAEDSVASLQPGPGSLIARRNELRLLLAGLRCLPLDVQILLEQHYFEGISCVELARDEEIPASTMRGRLARARELLESEIAKLDAEGPLIASTIDYLDDWAADVRGLIHGGSAEPT